MAVRRKSKNTPAALPQAYSHPEATSPARPEIGAQAHFKKTKAPAKYCYDSSLAPELVWDEGNPAREDAEKLIAELSDHGLKLAELAMQDPSKERDAEIKRLEKAIREARRALATMSGPFLNWTGKAERPSFEVPTLPLFIHERLSTKVILESLSGHKIDKQDDFLTSLFGCQDRSLHDQVLKAYEYPDQWVNRMMLGDSLVCMNSLLQFEHMAGKVQMFYIDPPYGVKFGSNFQPFIRKREVKHNEDEDFTREPEMVQAYRDTWELGLHSYLTYLRDRLRVARELLHDSGSVFVQISDENLHHVRELMDEVFGAENSVGLIVFAKTSSATSSEISSVADFILWYAKDKPRIKFRPLYLPKELSELTDGSGTTAYVAEQWGRRWITCDTSRVPLALARQRLLTATFDYHELKDEKRGPIGGFVYQRKQNKKGEEVGGIVPHVTLKSIANNEPAAEEVLVDRPEVVKSVTRVTGPFVFEATIPTAEGLDEDPVTPGIQSEEYQDHVTRMIEVLRKAPVLRLPGNQTVTLKQIRPPAKTLGLSAEAMVEGSVGVPPASSSSTTSEPVAILFGPETGPISERFVREAWDEAGLKRYTRLFVIGFGIDPKAREFIDNAGKIGIPAFYLQATMDLQMGDLLKNMRSSHVFSVCGLPDVQVSKAKPGPDKAERWQVELLGLETFDPVTMEADSVSGKEVPAWFLDTDYNGMVFKVRQAFFPRTGAWEKLKKSLKVEFEEGVWDHLAGTTSAPFEPGEQRRIAVKVIDPRGNELLAVKKLEEK